MGLSDKQIVAMGEIAFVNKYTDKYGGSTFDMAVAERLYGETVAKVNDKALKHRPAEIRAMVKTLRPAMRAYFGEMVDIGRASSGGGSIWTVIGAGATADVEETIAIFSGVRKNNSKAHVVSDAVKSLNDLAKTLEETAPEIDAYKESGGGMAEVRSSLKSARTQFADIIRIAANRPRRQSDAIIEFCLHATKVPQNEMLQ